MRKQTNKCKLKGHKSNRKVFFFFLYVCASNVCTDCSTFLLSFLFSFAFLIRFPSTIFYSEGNSFAFLLRLFRRSFSPYYSARLEQKMVKQETKNERGAFRFLESVSAFAACNSTFFFVDVGFRKLLPHLYTFRFRAHVTIACSGLPL